MDVVPSNLMRVAPASANYSQFASEQTDDATGFQYLRALLA